MFYFHFCASMCAVSFDPCANLEYDPVFSQIGKVPETTQFLKQKEKTSFLQQ